MNTTNWNHVTIKADQNGSALFFVSTETTELFSIIVELLETDYQNLAKALVKRDFETIWRIGRTLVGRGHSYGLKALTVFGRLFELESQCKNENELRYTVIGLSNFIDKLRFGGDQGSN